MKLTLKIWKMVFPAAVRLMLSTQVFADTTDDQVFNLGEIVVTGAKTTVNDASTVTEVSIRKISAKGATTAADALKFLPGVYVRVGGKGEAHLSVRGFEQHRIKVLVDGVPAKANYAGRVDFPCFLLIPYRKLSLSKAQAPYYTVQTS